MSVTIPLEKMTREDKLRAMECLWDDLCRDPDSVESPAWHEQVLQRREEALQAGTEKVLDWRDAKKKIRESLS